MTCISSARPAMTMAQMARKENAAVKRHQNIGANFGEGEKAPRHGSGNKAHEIDGLATGHMTPQVRAFAVALYDADGPLSFDQISAAVSCRKKFIENRHASALATSARKLLPHPIQIVPVYGVGYRMVGHK